MFYKVAILTSENRKSSPETEKVAPKTRFYKPPKELGIHGGYPTTFTTPPGGVPENLLFGDPDLRIQG